MIFFFGISNVPRISLACSLGYVNKQTLIVYYLDEISYILFKQMEEIGERGDWERLTYYMPNSACGGRAQ